LQLSIKGTPMFNGKGLLPGLKTNDNPLGPGQCTYIVIKKPDLLAFCSNDATKVANFLWAKDSKAYTVFKNCRTEGVSDLHQLLKDIERA
jgi:hypothetical protein